MKMFSFVLLATLAITASVHSAPHNVTLVNEFGDEKIVGGRLVNIEDFPYQVAIFDSHGIWCGGSILTAHHVLTAAHCNYDGALPAVIRAGSSYFTEGGSLHHVVDYITLGRTSNTEIGIMKVQEPFVFDKTRQPITLSSAEPKPGTMATVTGWGDTRVQLKYRSKQLMAVDVPIVSRKVCDDIFHDTPIGPIGDGQLCAGYMKTGGKDACFGDDGGPMTVNGLQVGLVTVGYGCGLVGYPGVYADTTKYIDWIKKQIKQ